MWKKLPAVWKIAAFCLTCVLAVGLVQSCITVRLLPPENGTPGSSNGVATEPRAVSSQPPLRRTPTSPYRKDVQAYLDELADNKDAELIRREAKSTGVDSNETERTIGGDLYVCKPDLMPVEPDTVEQFLALSRDDDSDVLLPGVFLRQQAFRGGRLVEIPVARSPITLSINLPVKNTSRTIQNPTSSAIRQAVAELMREADDRLNLTATKANLDIIPANLDYKSAVTYSFEHAMYEAGLSVGYQGGLFSAGMEASYSNENMVSKKTIICRMVQPMYTISFITDTYELPADHFGESVTRQGLEVMQDMIYPLPFYIKSVTYGRMLLYSVSSSEAASAQDVKVAVDAAYAGFSGGADFSAETEQKMSNLDKEVKNWGGTQQMAFTALRTENFQEFFRPTPAGNAVPLFYTVRTLDRKPVRLENRINNLYRPNCERQPGSVDTPVHTGLPFYLKNEEGAYAVSTHGNKVRVSADISKRVIELSFDPTADNKITELTPVYIKGDASFTGYMKSWGAVYLTEKSEGDPAQEWFIERVIPEGRQAPSADEPIRYGERVKLHAKDQTVYLTTSFGLLHFADKDKAQWWVIAKSDCDDLLKSFEKMTCEDRKEAYDGVSWDNFMDGQHKKYACAEEPFTALRNECQ